MAKSNSNKSNKTYKTKNGVEKHNQLKPPKPEDQPEARPLRKRRIRKPAKNNTPKEPVDIGPIPEAPSRKGRRPRILYFMEHAPEEYQRFLSYIQAGAWDWVAADYLGIPHQTFYRWLRMGQKDFNSKTGRNVPLNCYGRFYQDVNKARCHARINAEMSVRVADPRYWLKQAAKSKPGRPGWTEDAAQLEITDSRASSQNTPSSDDAEKAQAVLQQIILGADRFSDSYHQQNPQDENTPETQGKTPVDKPSPIPYNGGGNGDSKTKSQ